MSIKTACIALWLACGAFVSLHGVLFLPPGLFAPPCGLLLRCNDINGIAADHFAGISSMITVSVPAHVSLSEWRVYAA